VNDAFGYSLFDEHSPISIATAGRRMTPPLHRAPIMTAPLVLIVAAAIKVGACGVF
jgi:hypothetical protein